jgi:formylmethanofuran dehydrogenase subunit E
MPTLEKLLHATASRHQRLCPRQVLGVRMGIVAARLLQLALPQADKRLFTFMETDGCAADGVSVATGCWVGRRTMRIMDYGKVAATFVDTQTNQAIRIYPHPESRHRAQGVVPDAPSHWHAQLAAYQIIPDDELLVIQPVTLSVSLEEIMGRPGVRTTCCRCGEEIINNREVWVNNECLCRACAGNAYYSLDTNTANPQPIAKIVCDAPEDGKR